MYSAVLIEDAEIIRRIGSFFSFMQISIATYAILMKSIRNFSFACAGVTSKQMLGIL